MELRRVIAKGQQAAPHPVALGVLVRRINQRMKRYGLKVSCYRDVAVLRSEPGFFVPVEERIDDIEAFARTIGVLRDDETME